MFESRPLDPPAAPNTPREITCAAKNAHTPTRPRRPLLTVAAVLWVGVVLLSGSALNEAAATEPAKTAASSTPQTSPIKVLWSKEYDPADIEHWKKKFPKKADDPWSGTFWEPQSILQVKDGILMASAMRVVGGTLNTYLMKISNEGELVWQRSYGVALIGRMVELADGYVFFVGDKPGGGRIVKIDKMGKQLQEWQANQVQLYYQGESIVDKNKFISVTPPNFPDCDEKACHGWMMSHELDKDSSQVEIMKVFELPVPKEVGKKSGRNAFVDEFLRIPHGWLVLMHFAKERREERSEIITAIASFNEQGQLGWMKTYLGPGKTSYLTGIVPTVDGYLATGYARSESDFTKEAHKPWLVKLDKEGNKQYERVIDMAGSLRIVDKLGDDYLVAFAHYRPHGKRPVDIVRMNTQGDFIWQVQMPEPGGRVMKSEEGYLLVGEGRKRSFAITKIQVAK